MAVCAQWRRGEGVGVYSAAKTIDARDYGAIGFIDFENGATLARVVQESIGQNRVIDRLPEVIGRAWGKPVGVECPDFHKVATLPGEFVLVPALCAVSAVAVSAILGLEEHVIPVNQRNLVMDVQPVKRIGISSLGGNIGVVHDVDQVLTQRLAGGVAQKLCVLWIEGPLPPILGGQTYRKVNKQSCQPTKATPEFIVTPRCKHIFVSFFVIELCPFTSRLERGPIAHFGGEFVQRSNRSVKGTRVQPQPNHGPLKF